MYKHPNMLLSNTFENTGRTLRGFDVFFKIFLTFFLYRTPVISTIFKQDGNEDDLKELLIFVHKVGKDVQVSFHNFDGSV